MSASTPPALPLLLGTSLLLATSALAAERPVGFQRLQVPGIGPAGAEVGLWYPSKGSPARESLGLWSQEVVVNGPVAGSRMPVIMLSHGVFGSLASHVDLAVALARAGFLAAAVTHPGDNDREQSLLAQRADLLQRPEAIRRVLDHLFSSWPGRRHLQPEAAGIFGFSLGAFTALAALGGEPDLAEIPKFCAIRSSAPECVFIASRHGDQSSPFTGPAPRWAHVPSLKVAVIAAPALGFAFSHSGLEGVRVPVQLWRAELDRDAPDEWNSALIRTRLPRPPEEHVVPAAWHSAFLPPCRSEIAASVPAACSDPPGFDRAKFHQLLLDSVVAFFQTHLGPHQDRP